MLSNPSLSSLLTVLVQWVADSPQILAAALVGSYARGEARPDSDVDLMIIANVPDHFRHEIEWLRQIKWEHIQAQILEWTDADYGLVWSRHIRLSNGRKIEFSFGPPE